MEHSSQNIRENRIFQDSAFSKPQSYIIYLTTKSGAMIKKTDLFLKLSDTGATLKLAPQSNIDIEEKNCCQIDIPSQECEQRVRNIIDELNLTMKVTGRENIANILPEATKIISKSEHLSKYRDSPEGHHSEGSLSEYSVEEQKRRGSTDNFLNEIVGETDSMPRAGSLRAIYRNDVFSTASDSFNPRSGKKTGKLPGTHFSKFGQNNSAFKQSQKYRKSQYNMDHSAHYSAHHSPHPSQHALPLPLPPPQPQAHFSSFHMPSQGLCPQGLPYAGLPYYPSYTSPAPSQTYSPRYYGYPGLGVGTSGYMHHPGQLSQYYTARPALSAHSSNSGYSCEYGPPPPVQPSRFHREGRGSDTLKNDRGRPSKHARSRWREWEANEDDDLKGKDKKAVEVNGMGEGEFDVKCLCGLFSNYGNVTRGMLDKQANYAILEFSVEQGAKNAIEVLNNLNYKSSTLSVISYYNTSFHMPPLELLTPNQIMNLGALLI